MSAQFELNATVRQTHGSGANRRLRQANEIPGVIYGGKEEAVSITVGEFELTNALKQEAFFSHILTIKVGDKKEKAVLKALHRHPSKPTILHFDLLRVSKDSEITMKVPLHFVGDEAAPGVKQGGGTVFHLQTEVEIKCLPKNLPEFIEVDISNLELDSAIHLSELTLPSGVTLTELAHGSEHDFAVVNITVPKRQAVEEAAAEETAEDAEAGDDKSADDENKSDS